MSIWTYIICRTEGCKLVGMKQQSVDRCRACGRHGEPKEEEEKRKVAREDGRDRVA